MCMRDFERLRVAEEARSRGRWRACVLYKLDKPNEWAEYSAGTLSDLLRRLEGCVKALRIIIYREW